MSERSHSMSAVPRSPLGAPLPASLEVGRCPAPRGPALRRAQPSARRRARCGVAPIAAVVAAAGLAACQPAPPVPGIDLTSARIPLALDGTCDANGDFTDFTSEVVNLRAVVTGPGIDGSIVGEGAFGQLTVEEIPAGEDRTVALYGLNQAGAATWRSVREGVTVNQDTQTHVDMLMARVADLNCTRTLMDQARAYHSATVLLDGRILILGGAASDNDCGGARCLTASSFAELYNPEDGTFSRIGSALNQGRMFHTATLLPDGRVIIAGGATEAEIHDVDGTNPFPLRITAVANSVEVFDLNTGTFTVIAQGADYGRAFHAATVMSEGEQPYAVISGGVNALTNAADVNDLGNAFNTTFRCGGQNLSCAPWNAMVKPRAGHMSFQLDTGQVVMWGGAVDTTDVNDVRGWQLEWAAPGGAFQLLNVQGAPGRERNLFFASMAQYVGFRVLAAGGLLRNPDGTFDFATLGGNGEEAVVYVYDASFPPVGGISVGQPGNAPMSLSTPRFLGSAAPLDTKRVLVVGGFSALTFNASSDLAIYDESNLSVSPLSVGGQPRTLRQARGGLVATAVGDGTILVTGGESGLGQTRAPVNTAEIFADPVDPAADR